MACCPCAALFDEPISALDPDIVSEVLDMKPALALDGITMVVVTHEMSFARRVANRVLFLDNGEIVENSSREQYYAAPRSDRARQFLSKVIAH